MSESTILQKWKIGFASPILEAREQNLFHACAEFATERVKMTITQNCAKGCAGRYAQNSAHLRTELKIQF